MTCFYFINKDSIYQQLYVCGLLVFRVPELLVQERLCSTSTGADCIIYHDVNSYGCAAHVYLHLAEHRT